MMKLSDFILYAFVIISLIGLTILSGLFAFAEIFMPLN